MNKGVCLADDNVAGDKNGMDLFTRDMLTWILPKLCEDKANLLSKRQEQQNEKPANTASCGLSNANIIQVGRAKWGNVLAKWAS